MSQDIESRVNSSLTGLRKLNQLENGESATIKLIVAAKQDIERLSDLNISVGQKISSLGNNSFQIANMALQLDNDIAQRVLISE